MKELRPIHTFLLFLATFGLLSLHSLISWGDEGDGTPKIDIFSDLREQNSYSDMQSDEQMGLMAEFDATATMEPTAIEPLETATSERTELAETQSTEPTETNSIESGSATHSSEQSLANTTSQVANEPANTPEDAPTKTKEDTEVLGEIENSIHLSAFYHKLRNMGNLNRPVRIAVLGDSFIEGDIFTQDLREMMQSQFGGSGVGFMPMHSEIPGFRRSVKQYDDGWSSYSIAKTSSKGGYLPNSELFIPSSGSRTNFKGSTHLKHLATWDKMHLIYTNEGNSTLRTIVNDTVSYDHTPEQSQDLQCYTISHPETSSVSFRIPQSDNITFYGAVLDGASGVSVDNYSLRGSSGMTLTRLDEQLTTQFGQHVPIDLIILQYGLNITQATVRNYDSYTTTMKSAIELLQRCFPDTAILIMGVPDKAYSTASGWQTTPGIIAMDEAQRQLAQDCDVSFWSTLQTMGNMGGMQAFVKRRHAAKDYTHLSHRGGQVLAVEFYKILMNYL